MAVDTAREDPRITPLRAALNAVDLMPIEGVTFVGETVYLDGRDFIRCTFRNCTLISSTGRFQIEGDQTYTLPLTITFEDPIRYGVVWRDAIQGGLKEGLGAESHDVAARPAYPKRDRPRPRRTNGH